MYGRILARTHTYRSLQPQAHAEHHLKIAQPEIDAFENDVPERNAEHDGQRQASCEVQHWGFGSGSKIQGAGCMIVWFRMANNWWAQCSEERGQRWDKKYAYKKFDIEVVGTYCGKAEARHNMTPGTT